MSPKTKRLAKTAISHASALKDRFSNSLSKSVHTHLEGFSHLDGSGIHDDPLRIVCSACRAGPFSCEGFRKAVAEGHYSKKTGYCYTRTWREIAESVDKEGCEWCRIVIRTRDGLPTKKFPYGKESVEVRLQVEASSVSNGVIIYLDGNKAATYTIYANKGDPAVKEIGEERTMFPKEPYVDYQKALEHIEKCSHHKHCAPPEETYLPTRVIDCFDPTKPRLVETNRKIMGHYCTLSYVWGGEQHQKTTTSNLHTYVNEGINVSLPQTIADAILVTNKLGLRYLWVDALCIIQDSAEDKVRELGIMAHIYRDAYLTISVLSAYRADEGFLPDQRPTDVLPYYLARNSKSPGRMVLEYDIPRQTPGLGKYETVVTHRPLDKRGWCFQESALSPRRLIFQPPHVSYKCRSFTEVDISRPSPFDRFHEDQTAYPADDHILFPIKAKHGDGSRDVEHARRNKELRKSWRDTLLNYSERKITVASDKFVALASIVEVFQSVMNDQYIAGLWKNNLLADLLWKVWPPMGPEKALLPRPQGGYRAPTWSWASVDGKLDLSVDLEPPASAASYVAEIVECKATPKFSELPFGELVDGKLIIRAKIHPLMRDGRKCTFTVHKGTSSGTQFVKHFSAWTWTPPAGNCLESSDGVIKKLKLEGKDGDEGSDDAENDCDDSSDDSSNESDGRDGKDEDSDDDEDVAVADDDEDSKVVADDEDEIWAGDDSDDDENEEEDEDENENEVEENEEGDEDEDEESDDEGMDEDEDGSHKDGNGVDDDEEDDQKGSQFTFDCLEGTEAGHSLDFYVLILRAGKKYRLQGDWMQGLLLVRVDGKEEQYRRVAFLEVSEWPDWFDDAPLKVVTLV